MTKNAEKQKGITLIALIITIIVMLILVGVTLNIALGENGLIEKAKYARQKQEEQTILEQIIALATWDKNGNIEVENTYARVEEQFNILESYWNPTKTDVRFKIQGKFGIYSYKIDNLEIIIDDGKIPKEDTYFTFNMLEQYATDNALTNYKEFDAKELTEGKYFSSICFSSEMFWKAIGVNYAGQYGVDIALNLGGKTLSTKELETDKNFTFYHKETTSDDSKKFSFFDISVFDGVYIYLSIDNKAFVNQNGDSSNDIMSYEEFLEEYGDVKFYFDDSNKGRQSFFIKTNFTDLQFKDPFNTITVENSTYTNTLQVTDEDFALPTSILVIMGGKKLALTDYSYDSTTGEIIIQNVTGEIEITASASYNVAQVTYEVENAYYSGINKTTKNTTFTNTFTPYWGYLLPEEIEVTMGDTVLSKDENEYSWNKDTGILEISNVQGDLKISIVPINNTVNFKQIHVYPDGTTDEGTTSILKNETYSDSFFGTSTEKGIVLPKDLQIVMGTTKLINGVDYTFTHDLSYIATLEIFNITSDIVMTINYKDSIFFSYDGTEENMKEWRILNNGTETIEIISPEPLGNLTLGYDDPTVEEAIKNGEVKDLDEDGQYCNYEKAINSYNNALKTINDYCNAIVKNTKKSSVRNFGSNPNNPYEENTKLIEFGRYFFDKLGKDNYSNQSDSNSVNKNNILLPESSFWIYKRIYSGGDFYISKTNYRFWYVLNNLTPLDVSEYTSGTFTYPVLPIVKLNKSDITWIDGEYRVTN